MHGLFFFFLIKIFRILIDSSVSSFFIGIYEIILKNLDEYFYKSSTIISFRLTGMSNRVSLERLVTVLSEEILFAHGRIVHTTEQWAKYVAELSIVSPSGRGLQQYFVDIEVDKNGNGRAYNSFDPTQTLAKFHADVFDGRFAEDITVDYKPTSPPTIISVTKGFSEDSAGVEEILDAARVLTKAEPPQASGAIPPQRASTVIYTLNQTDNPYILEIPQAFLLTSAEFNSLTPNSFTHPHVLNILRKSAQKGFAAQRTGMCSSSRLSAVILVPGVEHLVHESLHVPADQYKPLHVVQLDKITEYARAKSGIDDLRVGMYSSRGIVINNTRYVLLETVDAFVETKIRAHRNKERIEQEYAARKEAERITYTIASTNNPLVHVVKDIAVVTRDVMKTAGLQKSALRNSITTCGKFGFSYYSIPLGNLSHSMKCILTPRGKSERLHYSFKLKDEAYKDLPVIRADNLKRYAEAQGKAMPDVPVPSFVVNGVTYHPQDVVDMYLEGVTTITRYIKDLKSMEQIKYAIAQTNNPLVHVVKDIAVVTKTVMESAGIPQRKAFRSIKSCEKKGFIFYSVLAEHSPYPVMSVLIPKGKSERLHHSFKLKDEAYKDLPVIRADNLEQYAREQGKTLPEDPVPSVIIGEVTYHPREVVDMYLNKVTTSKRKTPRKQRQSAGVAPAHDTSSLEGIVTPITKSFSKKNIDIQTYTGQGKIQEINGRRIYVNGTQWFEMLEDTEDLVKYSDVLNALSPALAGEAQLKYKNAGTLFLRKETNIAHYRTDEHRNHSGGGRGIKLKITQKLFNKACMAVIDYCTHYSAQGPIPTATQTEQTLISGGNNAPASAVH
jgi:hypothetical protein